ncbi:MAG: hypothetical protein JWO65_1165 [Sphingomonas bacterium]|nr:hypothetical protein [Sphingomonas bacterium]
MVLQEGVLIAALISVALLASNASPPTYPVHRWATYQNARFGTAAEYPSDVFVSPTYSDNGDGVVLRAASGAKLIISGGNNALNWTPKTYYDTIAKSDPRSRVVSYRLIKPKLLAFSGTTHGMIFYERDDFSDPTGVIHTVHVEYPANLRTTYDPIVQRISHSLRWSAVRVQHSAAN